MYWCIDELGAFFVVIEKCEDKPDESKKVLVAMKEVFMIIPSKDYQKDKTIVYHFSEFDYGGNIPNILKQQIRKI